MIQKVAFILIGLGVLTISGFLLWWFIAAPDLHVFWKITMGLVVVGIFILLAMAGWDKYRAYKEKEKEFKRLEY